MFTRAFNVVGLIVRIAEAKASLLAFAARRSVVAMLGYFIAAIVALGGLAILLGAGYVALEAIVGVSIALTAVGVCLLLIASLIWIIANRREKGTGEPMTEDDVRKNVARDEDLLRSKLGMTNDEDKPNFERPGPRTRSSPQFDSFKSLDDPKVLMAAGFALLGLLGPGRLFRTVRIATALASIAALASRAITEHGTSKARKDRPDRPTQFTLPAQCRSNAATDRSPRIPSTR